MYVGRCSRVTASVSGFPAILGIILSSVAAATASPASHMLAVDTLQQ